VTLLSLLSACVDVMSSNAYLNAIGAMEMSQMCVQAVWDSDSPLKQIPGFTSEVIKRCESNNVKSVYDIMELEDEDRDKILQMDGKQMRSVAQFCNSYPSIELAYEIEDAEDVAAGDPITLNIQLEREVDDDEEIDITVPAPFYPGRKQESWYLTVLDQSSKQYVLLSFLALAVE